MLPHQVLLKGCAALSQEILVLIAEYTLSREQGQHDVRKLDAESCMQPLEVAVSALHSHHGLREVSQRGTALDHV